jgi:hypothetical protein
VPVLTVCCWNNAVIQRGRCRCDCERVAAQGCGNVWQGSRAVCPKVDCVNGNAAGSRDLAGCIVDSGTMGNLISVGVHCGRGDEVILGTESHIFNYEQGGCSGKALECVPSVCRLVCRTTY